MAKADILLRRVREAAGLTTLLADAGFRRSAAEKPETLHLVRSHVPELKARFAELGGHNVAVFGSVARGDDGPNSDVDLLIDLEEDVGLFKIMKMRAAAEQILGRDVDIVPRAALNDEASATALSDEVLL